MAKPLTKQDVAELIQLGLERQNEQLGTILKRSFDHIDDEFRVVKADIRELKADVATLKTDMSEVKVDLKQVAWRYELDSLQRRFDTIEQDVKFLKSK